MCMYVCKYIYREKWYLIMSRHLDNLAAYEGELRGGGDLSEYLYMYVYIYIYIYIYVYMYTEKERGRERERENVSNYEPPLNLAVYRSR